MAGSDGRLRVRGWLEQLWCGVSKVCADFDARSFCVSVVPGGQITVTFPWTSTEERTALPLSAD
jgi:hypothetical protein